MLQAELFLLRLIEAWASMPAWRLRSARYRVSGLEREREREMCRPRKSPARSSAASVVGRIVIIPQGPMLVTTDPVRGNLDIANLAASDEDPIHTLGRVNLWSVLQA